MTTRLETSLLSADAAPERRGGGRAESFMERFRAPFSLRCGALLVDYILLAAIVAFSTLLARMGSHQRASQSSMQTVGIFIAVFVAAINFVVLPALRGQTLGKWVTGLRVRRTDGRAIGLGRSLLRHLILYPPIFILGLAFLITDLQTTAGLVDVVVNAIKGMSGTGARLGAIAGVAAYLLIPIVGFAMAAFSENGRALHDIVADTVVVRETVKRRRRSESVSAGSER